MRCRTRRRHRLGPRGRETGGRWRYLARARPRPGRDVSSRERPAYLAESVDRTGAGVDVISCIHDRQRTTSANLQGSTRRSVPAAWSFMLGVAGLASVWTTHHRVDEKANRSRAVRAHPDRGPDTRLSRIGYYAGHDVS